MLLVAGALLAAVSPARAEVPDGTPSAAASPPPAAARCTDKPEVCGKRAFLGGVSAYQKGDWSSAIALFTEALGVKWHPAIALNRGLAESRAGRYLDALADLDAVIASPASTSAIKKQAALEKEAAEGELATIEIDAGGEQGTRIVVDGKAVDGAAPVRVDPGAHHLEISLANGGTIQKDVILSARERLHLSIDRTKELLVVPSRETVVQPGQEPATARADTHGVSPVWFYVTAGAAVALGAVTTWSALDTKSAYDDYQRALPTASQAEVDALVAHGHSLEARTNVLLAVTSVAALGAAAVGVFVVDWGPSRKAEVSLGPTGATLRTRF
jgi:hypothetical protein